MAKPLRARLVCSMIGDSKYSMGFHLGSLLCFRDLGLLPLVRVFNGVGTGNIVLCQIAWAARELGDTVEEGWAQLSRTIKDAKRDQDHLMNLVCLPLLAWCEWNQERSMQWYSLKSFCSPWQWMVSWGHILSHLMEASEWEAALRWWSTSYQHEDLLPTLILQGASTGSHKPLCITTDLKAPPSMPHLAVEFVSIPATPKDQLDVIGFVAASLCDEKDLGASVVKVKEARKVSCGLRVDPMGSQAARTYFMKHRLGPLPHHSTEDCKTQETLSNQGEEKGVSEKWLLCDGFTRGPTFYQQLRLCVCVCVCVLHPTHALTLIRYSTTTQHQALSALEDAVSEEDVRHERLLCFRKVFGRLFTDGVDLVHMPHKTEWRDFSRVFEDTTSCFSVSPLGPCNSELWKQCVNWGYWQTLWHHSNLDTRRIQWKTEKPGMPFPGTPDHFELRSYLSEN